MSGVERFARAAGANVCALRREPSRRALPRLPSPRAGKPQGMDTFRLNTDAVRRAMPDPPAADTETDETERLVERVREAEERVAHDEATEGS